MWEKYTKLLELEVCRLKIAWDEVLRKGQQGKRLIDKLHVTM